MTAGVFQIRRPKSEILVWRSQNQSRGLTADDADFTDGQNPLTLRNRN